MAAVSPAAAQSPSLFPEVPAITAEEHYGAIIKSAREEFDAKYEKYKRAFQDMPTRIGHWKTLDIEWANKPLDAVQKQRFWNEVGEYLKFREIRDDLLQMKNRHTEAIQKCEEHPMDAPTLLTIRRLGITLKTVKEKFDQIFSTELGALREQAAKIEDLYQQFVPTLLVLRFAGEPLAMLAIANSKGTGAELVISAQLRATPYFNQAKALKMKELEGGPQKPTYAATAAKV